MAYQPKSYRKFLATSVTAAMVATVAAPVIPSVSADTSFSDVASNHWAADAINYLVNKGAIEGYPNGTFQPNASITRAEAAKILAITLGLDVDESASTNFSDASNHWASSYIAALQSQASGVIDGYTDGTFRPNRTITRQEMAKMIVTAYDLQENEAANVDFTDNTGWGAEYITTLASLGIVEGVRAGQFQPNGNVTRAQTPVFVHRAEVPEVRIPVNGEQPVEFAISAVEALTEEGRFAEVTFTVPAGSNITRNDVNVTNARTGERIGIQEVDLSNDRRVLTVTFFENDIDRAILERGETYRFAVTHNGETYTYNFERPQYAEVRITDVDHEEGILTFIPTTSTERYEGPDSGTLEVGESEVDLEYVLGRDIRVWYNTEDEIVNVEVKNETVYYDAVEIDVDEEEVKLLTEDSELDFATDRDGDITTEVRINGDASEDVEDLAGEYDYAKVVLDSRGDIAFIDVYNWDDFILVEEVDGVDVLGYGEELSLEDYVIVKEGRTISIGDIEENDAVFFNADAEYAEVLNSTVTGVVENVFETEVEIDDELYTYAGDDMRHDAYYINEDGELDLLDSDALEQFEDSGEEVTVYLQRDGNIAFITGDLGNVATSTNGAYLTSDAIGYSQATRDRVELAVVDAEGDSHVYDFRLDSLDEITVDEVEYEVGEDFPGTNTEIEKFAFSPVGAVEANGSNITGIVALDEDDNVIGTVYTTNAGGSSVLFSESDALGVVTDEDGTIVGLEIYDANSGTFNDDDDRLEVGDRFVTVNGVDIRISNNTTVFIHDDGDFEAVYTWGELADEVSFDEISRAGVYFDNDNNADFLVIDENDTNVAEDEETFSGVVQSVQRNTSGDVVRMDVFINGQVERFTVDEVDSNVRKGELVELTINTNNDEVTEIFRASETNRIRSVVVNPSEVSTIDGTFEDANGRTYELTDDAIVFDATDVDKVEVVRLRDLRDLANDNTVHVFFASENTTRFVDKVVIVNDGESFADPTRVESVANLVDIEVPVGTTAEDLEDDFLPEQVQVTYDNGETANVNITWDLDSDPAYDENTPDIYEFTGTLTLPSGVSANGHTASVNVIVEAP